MKFYKQKDDHYIIGCVYIRGNKLIYITGGVYLGGYDRISNFFYWKEVLKDGSLGRLKCGYGDTQVKRVKCSIHTCVKVRMENK